MRVWNLNMVNLNLFKSTILSYYSRALETSYDPENPGTFKTICTKCNTARTLAQPACQLLLLIYMYILPPYYFNTYFTCLILGPHELTRAAAVTLPLMFSMS